MALDCISRLLKSASALPTTTHWLMARVTVFIMLVLVARAHEHRVLVSWPTTVLKVDHMMLLLLLGILICIRLGLVCVFFGSSFIDGLLLIVASVVQLS